MEITKQIEIDMAHRVPNHQSKCRNLHWHRYKIEVWVDDKLIDTKWTPDEWMVIDFSDLKEVMMSEIDEKFDHWAVFYSKDIYRNKLEEILNLDDQRKDKMHFVDFIPTAENLCKMWYNLLEPKLKEKWVKIKFVKVWETPTSTAIYTLNNKNEDN